MWKPPIDATTNLPQSLQFQPKSTSAETEQSETTSSFDAYEQATEVLRRIDITDNDAKEITKAGIAITSETILKKGISQEQRARLSKDLLLACNKGKSASEILSLINQGADVNYQDKQTLDTPLILSCSHFMHREQMAVISALIENGANINHKNFNGLTALNKACIGIEYKIADFLIDNGADVNNACIVSKNTPLINILEQSNNLLPQLELLIKKIIEKGGDVNHANDDDETPLIFACQKNASPSIINILLNKGANVNHKTKIGDTAANSLLNLYKNSKNLSNEALLSTMQLLINHGMNVNQITFDETCLTSYCQHKNIFPTLIQCLINAGADVNHQNFCKDSALHLITSHPNQDSAVLKSVILQLIDHGAKLNVENMNRKTPLMLACKNEDLTADVLVSLIDAGSNVNHVNARGETPLMCACKYNPKLVSTLMYFGARCPDDQGFLSRYKTVLDTAKEELKQGVYVSKIEPTAYREAMNLIKTKDLVYKFMKK